MELLALRRFGDLIVAAVPDNYRAEAEAGLPLLLLSAERLGLEVLDAEARGVSFVDAVALVGDYPLMSRTHHALIPHIRECIPVDAVPCIRAMLRSSLDGDFAEVRQVAMLAAHPAQRTASSAVLRFLLFQGCRLNLWLASRRRPAVEAVGVLARMDRRAENHLREMLTAAPRLGNDVNAFDLMVKRLIVDGAALAAEVERRVRAELPHLLDEFERLAAALSSLPTADTVPIRNELAQLSGGEVLDGQRLADRHPDLFPTREALYKRAERLPERVARTIMERPTKRGISLADLIDEIEREVA